MTNVMGSEILIVKTFNIKSVLKSGWIKQQWLAMFYLLEMKAYGLFNPSWINSCGLTVSKTIKT